MYYVEYNIMTGQIEGSGHMRDITSLTPKVGMAYKEVPAGTSNETHYVDTATLDLIPITPLDISVDQETIDVNTGIATFTNIPIGCPVDIEGQITIINDGVLEFSATLEGIYPIWFGRQPPFFEQRFKMRVV